MTVEIKPGPELDRAVAEAVGVRTGEPKPYCLWETIPNSTACCRCGRLFSEVGRCPEDFQHCDSCRKKWEADKWASEPPPCYSTDLNAAIEAAEKVSSYCYLFSCTELMGQWECKLSPRDAFSELVHAPTAALAICAAILKLKGVNMPAHVTHDELHRVAQLLDELAARCYEDAGNRGRPVDDRRRFLSEGIAYETAAVRLRETVVTAE